jgi:hypothetical protein
MNRFIAPALLAVALAVPSLASAEDMIVTINETKIDSLINSMNQLTSALTSSNVAVSGVGAAAGGASQMGAGAASANRSSVTEAGARASDGIATRFVATGQNLDVGADEAASAGVVSNNNVQNALATLLLQQATAAENQRLRFAEDLHAQTLRHSDLATYHQWGVKPPVVGAGFATEDTK